MSVFTAPLLYFGAPACIITRFGCTVSYYFRFWGSLGSSGEVWGTFGKVPEELRGTLGELWGAPGQLRGPWGSSGELLGALGSRLELLGASGEALGKP